MRVLPFVFVAASFGATACVSSYEVDVQSKGAIVARWPWLPCTGDAAPHCRAAFYRWQDTHEATDARDEMREAVRVAESADPISRALVYYDLAVVLRQMGDIATARMSIAFATKLHPEPSYDALRSDLAAQGAAAPLPENDGFYKPIAVALGEKPSVAAPAPAATTPKATPSTPTPSVPTTMTAGGQTFPWVCHGKVTLDGVQVKIDAKQLIEVSEDCDLTIINSTLELVHEHGETIGVRKGALTVKNSTLRATGFHGRVLHAAGAKVAFEDSTIYGADPDEPAVWLVDTADSNKTPTVADFKKTTLHADRGANGSALSVSHSKVTATGLTADGRIGCGQNSTMKLEKTVATTLSVGDCAVNAVDSTIDVGSHGLFAAVTVDGGSLKAIRLAVTGTDLSSRGLIATKGTVDLEDATIAVQGEALSATDDSKIVLTRGTFTGFEFSAVSIRTGATLDARDAHFVTNLKVGLALYVLTKSPATNAVPSAHLKSCTLEGNNGLLVDSGGTVSAEDTTVKAVSEGATVRGSSSITMTRGSVSADYAAVLAKSGTIVLKKTKITGPTKADGGTITGP